MSPYWIVVARTAAAPAFLRLGIGVTARSEGDARDIVRDQFGEGITICDIKRILDMNDLEQHHVAPNMEPNWMIRGVWFPVAFGNFHPVARSDASPKSARDVRWIATLRSR
jgi:hypothetical protein